MKKQSAALATFMLTACCVGAPQPRHEPSPRITPTPPPPPAPIAVGNDWRDWPITPGDWRYARDAAGSAARFGPAGAAPELTIACDTTSRGILLARTGPVGAAPTALTIQTSTGATAHATTPRGADRPIEARLAARDPALDAMAFSRGRFMIMAAGVPRLIAPAWPEVARVIEDCR